MNRIDAWVAPAANQKLVRQQIDLGPLGDEEVEVRAEHCGLGPRGVRVNAVAPGVIETDMSHFTKTEAGRGVTLAMQALNRIGQPSDVADVIAFVASDGARWITGANLPADGGSKL